VSHTPHYTPAPVYQQKETVKEEVKPEKSKPVEKAEEKESQVSVSSAQEETATTVKNDKTKEVSTASTQSGAEESQTKTAWYLTILSVIKYIFGIFKIYIHIFT